MRFDDEDNFDLQLREHLSRQLDPQRGRAMAAIKAEARQQHRRRMAIRIGSALAVAASIAVAWFVWMPSKSSLSPTMVIASADAPRDVEQVVAWETSDEGLAMLDRESAPVRAIHQQGIEQVKWFDPQANATVRVTVPQEQVILVDEQTY
jgi:hypothetical protein